MATLKDVAKRAKVSVTTASYAINDSPQITKETKQKVLDAAKEIGYRPNGMAKNLKQNRTNIIGVFISGFTGPFFNEMLEGVHEVVMREGYELVVCASVDKHRLLIEQYVDGAIIFNFHMKDELLERVASEKMPLVVMDREIDHPYIHNLVLPNREGIEEALVHLVDKGHRHIGFMAGSEKSYDGEMRLSAYQRFMEGHGLGVESKNIIRADFTELSGYLTMKDYLDRLEKPLTAFVCANDEMAIGAIKAINEHGINVPTDIAVVGFDDIEISQFITPALTTVRVQKKHWGIQAAETLFKMVDKQFDVVSEVPALQLIKRSSG